MLESDHLVSKTLNISTDLNLFHAFKKVKPLQKCPKLQFKCGHLKTLLFKSEI